MATKNKTTADLVIHIHASDYDRIHQACAFAASGASLGQSVVLAFYMYALKKLVNGDLDTLFAGEESGQAEELAAGMEKAGAPSAAQLLAHAKEVGTVTTYACSASAQFWGLTPQDLESKVDKVAGITTILRNTQGADTVLYI